MTEEKGNRASLVFVVALVLIDMIGFGIIMPVWPALIAELTGEGVAEGAVDSGILAAVYSVMQLIFAPIIGNLSDRFGRRPILLGTLFGYAIGYLIMGFAATLVWLFAARIITGIMGASFTAANAYVADVSAPEKRAQNFGLMGMAFGVGFIVGPALGGLLGEFGSRVPFFAAGGLAALNLIFGWFFLKESLPPPLRRPFSLARSNMFTALSALQKQSGTILWLAAAMMAWTFAFLVYPIIWAFFTIEKFGWSPRMIGVSLALVGVVSAIVQGGLMRVIVPRIGERRAVQIGAIAALAGMAIYIVGDQPWMLFAGIVVGGLNGLVQPSINGMMSRAVSNDVQGELQGALGAVSSVAAIFAPLLYTWLFFWATNAGREKLWAGAPFMAAAGFVLITLLLFWAGSRHIPRRSPEERKSAAEQG